MDAPAYVPQGARDHAQRFLGHYEPCLEKGERELARIDADIHAWSQRLQSLPPSEIPNAARDKMAELHHHRKDVEASNKQLESDINSVRRLIHDGRMKDAYRILSDAFFEDEPEERHRRLDGFIYAAWAARIDFTPYRDRLKRARQLKGDIAETANKLADLLRQIGETGQYLPPGFYGVDYLLRETDNTELNGKDLYMWRVMRGNVLGDPPRRTEPDLDEESSPQDTELTIRHLEPGEQPAIDLVEQARASVRYGWGVAPSVPLLLDTMADMARTYEPAEGGFIGAAVSGRKYNLKTEYLRAFGALLVDEHHFELTAAIRRAIAITANVVINDPEVDASFDDVRKALANLGGKSLEDSVSR